MRPTDMHKLAHHGCHDVCPKGYKTLPNVTGDYDLDATIMLRKNSNMPLRLALYTKTTGNSYGYRTNYRGYHGNSGDD